MGLRTEQKEERRDRILEAARQLIATKGYEALTMRDLAESSGVSVPTLYNLCGPKDQLLFQAVSEEVDATIDGLGSGAGSRSKGLRRVLALLGVGHEEMSRRPTYYRALLSAAARSEPAREPLMAIGSRLGSELRDALDEMAEDGELEGWVETAALAQRLRAVCVSASLEWATGALTTHQLLPATRYEAGLALLGVTRGAARTTVQRIVKKEQTARSRR